MKDAVLVSTVFIQINVLKSLIDSIANATIYTNFFSVATGYA